MKQYKKADNCGPVPYPDHSGRMLVDEVVSGEEWEPLVSLGFVVEVEGGQEAAEPVAAVAAEPVAEVSVPNAEASAGEMSNVASVDEGTGTEEVDPEAPGGSDTKSGASTRAPGRRGRRS